MDEQQHKIKVTVLKLIELAYKEDEGITTSLVKSKGSFTLKVDQSGEVTLSGKAGVVRVSASEEVKSFGVDFKFMSLMFFSNGRKLHYMGNIKFGVASIEIKSVLDVKELILSCSGLLCRAARSLRDRYSD